MIEIVSFANDLIIVVLREIRRYQKSIDLLIASTSFSRLMKKILHDNSDIVNKIQTSILIVLQKACEFYVVFLLEDE
jgi:histone H3